MFSLNLKQKNCFWLYWQEKLQSLEHLDVCFAEMLVMGLTRLSWERVDVSIQRFTAHSVIQVLASNHFCYHFSPLCFWFFLFYCEHSLATVVNLIIVVFFACWLSDRLRILSSIQKVQMLYNIWLITFSFERANGILGLSCNYIAMNW